MMHCMKDAIRDEAVLYAYYYIVRQVIIMNPPIHSPHVQSRCHVVHGYVCPSHDVARPRNHKNGSHSDPGNNDCMHFFLYTSLWSQPRVYQAEAGKGCVSVYVCVFGRNIA